MSDEADDDQDLDDFADLLGIPSSEAIPILGGPWARAEKHPDKSGLEEVIFVGRIGPSVAVKCDLVLRNLTVGVAVGQWAGAWPLIWDVQEPCATFAIGNGLDVVAFAKAVEVACKTKRRRLKVCRYCGELTAPEYMLDSDTCMGCSSRYFGIVY